MEYKYTNVRVVLGAVVVGEQQRAQLLRARRAAAPGGVQRLRLALRAPAVPALPLAVDCYACGTLQLPVFFYSTVSIGNLVLRYSSPTHYPIFEMWCKFSKEILRDALSCYQ